MGIVIRGAVVLLLAGALWGCKRETPQGGVQTNVTALSSADALVSGRVFFKGSAPPPTRLPLDAMCGKLHTTPPVQRDYVLGESNALAEVFVYLKGVAEGTGATPEPPVLDQQGCVYIPKIFGVMVNQKFKIRNSDSLLHNVHAMPKNNREFNFAQPIKGQVNERAFSEPEVLVLIKCDVHPWMKTYVGVVPHKFFTVTDEAGKFQLPRGLAAGKYTIEAVHPKAGRVAQEITVVAGANRPIELTLSQ